MSRNTGEFIPSIQYSGARTNIINRRTIDELLDVGGAAPTNNQVLTWDALLGLYVPRNPTGGGVSSLYDLIEVNITPPVNDGQVLTYTSGAWRPLSPNLSFYALTQISITPGTLNTGDVLIFNATTGLWTGGSAPSGSISGLSDVFIDGPISSGQLLTYDGTISKWRPTFFNAVSSVNGLVGNVTLTTDNINESISRQYYNNSRVETYLNTRSVDILADVSTSGATNNQVLAWDGTMWIPRSIGGIFSLRLQDLSDVFAVNPLNGQTIVWSSASNRWQPGSIVELDNTDDLPEGTVNKYASISNINSALNSISINALNDVQISVNTLTNGQLLVYSNGQWINSSAGAANTDGLPEGSTNRYYTDLRVKTYLNNNSINEFLDVESTGATGGQVLAWDAATSRWRPTTTLTSLTDTDNVPEGSTNRYFTDARVDARLNQISIDAFLDVDLNPPPQAGQALIYDASSGRWRPDDTTEVSTPLIYNSPGDTNGLINFLGTRGQSQTFTVPTSLSYPWLIIASLSTNLTGQPASNAIDRNNATLVHTSGAIDSTWTVDLGRNKTIKLDRYTIRGRADTDENLPRNWKLEGSIDSIVWVELHEQINGGPDQSQWWVSPALVINDSYRYLRIRQTDINSTGLLFLTMAEIEFYGLLNIRGVSAGVNSTDNLREGNINKYYTDSRVDTRLSQQTIEVFADVATSPRVDGSSLVWSSSNNRWQPTAINTRDLRIRDLTDVTITGTPVNNSVLAYDLPTQKWVPATFTALGVTSIDDLPDVDTSTVPPTINQALIWNGFNWIPGAPPQAVLSVNGQLGAVSLTTASITEAGGNFYFTNSRFLTQLRANTIQELSNVADTTPTTGQVLAFSGGEWRPTDVSAGGSEGLALQTLSTSGNVVVGNMYLVDITAATVNAALPIASNGARLAFKLIAGVAAGRVLNITTTETITAGSISDTTLTLDTIEQMVELTYRAGVWRITGAIIRG